METDGLTKRFAENVAVDCEGQASAPLEPAAGRGRIGHVPSRTRRAPRGRGRARRPLVVPARIDHRGGLRHRRLDRGVGGPGGVEDDVERRVKPPWKSGNHELGKSSDETSDAERAQLVRDRYALQASRDERGAIGTEQEPLGTVSGNQMDVVPPGHGPEHREIVARHRP